jgi:hypothetical protein
MRILPYCECRQDGYGLGSILSFAGGKDRLSRRFAIQSFCCRQYHSRYRRCSSDWRLHSDAIEIAQPSRLLFLCGTPGLDRDGRRSESFEAQADQAWKNVFALLELAGMGAAD